MTPAAEPHRVLISTVGVSGPHGVDAYTRDLALALLRRGWLPIIYTTVAGPLAEELRRATIPVITDINSIRVRPDVIHGHQSLETLAALAKFRDVPALFVCHDALAWNGIPPSSRRVRIVVAVDRNCRDRLVCERGIAAESVRVLLNAVDLERFRRRPPLPDKPRRALVFSNAATENGFAAPIRAACEARGISVDLAGLGSGKPVSHPEQILPEYDLVFGKARCAIEAAATGAAVIVCDTRGLAGMVTTENLDSLRQLNFGARTLQRPITRETIGAEIDRYDAADANAVCDRIRASASVDLLAAQYIAIYEELMSEPVATHAEEELEAMARTLNAMGPTLYQQLAAAQPSSLRRKLANSRVLAKPAQLAYRIRNWLRR